ncbi:MAG: RNA polymerase sigma factor [Planctomycetota bacterium]|jgi:RNA polymerase sigma-70 factor (ECF subfamily)
MTDTVNDDARDLADAAAGDHQAFARLFDRHAAVVLSLCRQKQPSMCEAEDAMQETFIRAFRRLQVVQAPDKLRPWLYGIARRVCSERRRAAGRRRRHEQRAARDGQLGATPAATPSDERASRAEQLAQLSVALDQLDERQRLAIHLQYLDPDPVAAASAALGLSRSGYYKLLARARSRLATLLRETVPTGIAP